MRLTKPKGAGSREAKTAATAAGRPSNGSSETTRDRLVAAASALMAERRSIELSLNDVAARAGVNSALVQYYFGGKTALLLEVLRTALSGGLRQLPALLAMDVPAVDKMRTHISAIIRSYYKYPYSNRLLHFLLLEDPEYFGPLCAEEFAKPIIDAQVAILEQGVREGVFKKVDPMYFYSHVMGACDQFAFGHHSSAKYFSKANIDDEVRAGYTAYLSDAILDGLLVKRR